MPALVAPIARVRRRRDRRSSSPTASSGGSRPGPVTRGFRLGQVAVGRAARARARHQRRAEDDGHDHARADRQRQPRRRAPTSPTWVVVSRRDRDRARHLPRRLADHQDDGQPHHQDGPGAGLRRPGLGRGGDPRRHALRLPALDDALDLRRGDGRRRRQAAVGRALGRRRQHRGGVGADAAGGRDRRGGRLRRHAVFGDGARGPGGGLGGDRRSRSSPCWCAACSRAPRSPREA